MALYAGRWIDPATGRVRMFPTASTKYLNPGSREQKLLYFKAQLLNVWNKLVDNI